MREAGLVFVALALSCGHLEIRGGESLPRGTVPEGLVVAVYEPTRCVNALGRAFSPEEVGPYSIERITVIEHEGTRRVLIERLGQESWWVRPAARAPGETKGDEELYQLSLGGAGEGDLLRDVRLRGRRGMSSWVHRYEERRAADGSIRAHFERAEISCELERRESSSGFPGLPSPPLLAPSSLSTRFPTTRFLSTRYLSTRYLSTPGRP